MFAVFSVLEAERTLSQRKENNPTMITKLVLAGVFIALGAVIYNEYVPWYASLAEIRKHNATIKDKKPVAIFVGGTSGIGEGAALKLAELTSHEKIIITGRNKVAGESIVAKLNTLTNHANNEFVPLDATLMKNVRGYTKEVKSKLDKLNYLVISTSPSSGGFFTRMETEEGIDKNMATGYYSRFLIIKELLPLLQKAADEGEDARVIIVGGAGREGAFDKNDMDLKKGYSLLPFANHLMTFSTVVVDKLARDNPDIAFIHSHPGFVNTPLLNLFPTGIKRAMEIAGKLFAITMEECGEIYTYELTVDKYKKGVHLVRQRGQEIPLSIYNTEENRELIYKHSVEITNTGK